ncbi:hypothetical protein BKA81DRAFT_345693 [Phyllosticta paracitricarpa]
MTTFRTDRILRTLCTLRKLSGSRVPRTIRAFNTLRISSTLRKFSASTTTRALRTS